jgi:hypothetical protein
MTLARPGSILISDADHGVSIKNIISIIFDHNFIIARSIAIRIAIYRVFNCNSLSLMSMQLHLLQRYTFDEASILWGLVSSAGARKNSKP